MSHSPSTSTAYKWGSPVQGHQQPNTGTNASPPNLNSMAVEFCGQAVVSFSREGNTLHRIFSLLLYFFIWKFYTWGKVYTWVVTSAADPKAETWINFRILVNVTARLQKYLQVDAEPIQFCYDWHSLVCSCVLNSLHRANIPLGWAKPA